MKRVAVLLFNLGGPLGQSDVKGFLYNLFKDKYIINLPWGARQAVAGLIATRREKLAQENYARMGGGSPILAETRAQANALEALLAKDNDMEARVFIGMRYWHPFIEDVAAEIAAFAPDEVILLPLYPQFSSTTTLSSFVEFKRAYRGSGKVRDVCCYAGNDDFIAAHVELIRDWLDNRVPDRSKIRLLFSAHGLPESIIKRGDPYQEQVETCVKKIMAGIGPGVDHLICYQSRVGPMKWIGPSTDDTIRAAGAEGRDLMVIPIAFVSEHIETLVELDHEYALLAKEAGVGTYLRVPALRTADGFICALAGEVKAALAAPGPITGDHDCAACYTFCPKRRVTGEKAHDLV